MRTTGTRMTPVWKSHLLDKHCNCNLAYKQCAYDKTKDKVRVFRLIVCVCVYRIGSGGSNPVCHSVTPTPAGRMECPQWSSWRLLRRWTPHLSLSHNVATHIYHVETAIPLPPMKRQTLKSNKGEEKQLNRQYNFCLFFSLHITRHTVYCLSRWIVI